MADAGTPHLPQPASIDSYGNGGFRFGGMSHRGSLLCFPDGIWAWPIMCLADLTVTTLEPALARAEMLDFFLIGTGQEAWVLPPPLRQRFHHLSLSVDAMPTGAAVRTYNILLAEDRRVGAGLIPVD